jgi:hypothetical protein
MSERTGTVADARTGTTPLDPQSEAPKPVRCLNCGSPMAQQYCPVCGQAATDPDPTLRELLHELAAEFLLWDGKLLTTFRLLVAKPGALTREYLSGHRVPYISPLKLYLTCSVVFFLLRASLPEPAVVVRSGGVVKTQVGGVVLEEREEGESVATLDSLARTGSSPLERQFGRRVGNALRHKKEFADAMRENTPRMMFVLVPLFAALTALIFRSRRMHYPKHLTFALHAHAFLFLALIPTLAPRILPRTDAGGVVSAILVLASFASIATYLVLALKAVYGGSLGGAIARSALLAGSYLALFTIALLTTVAIVMAVQF